MQNTIEAAWQNRELLNDAKTQETINAVIEQLDKGSLRVAEPLADGSWKVNDWVKKAVIMYFPIRKMETMELPPFEFYDKMALKQDYAGLAYVLCQVLLRVMVLMWQKV
jgi:2,3,4,5-tetrahydropyridine-2-carboxylate N-succinyltransferase